MAKEFDEELEMTEEPVYIEIPNDNGETEYYERDMVIPMEKNNFAILVKIILDDKGNFKDVDEDNVTVAKIEFDENGEEVYVDPTEEEFEAVRIAYEKIEEEWDD